MIGIVIATHGSMSKGIEDATKVIVGETDNLETLSLEMSTDIEIFGERLEEKIRIVDKGVGVIVFVDLLGASPYNQAMKTINKLNKENSDIYVISGVNLPLILETINHQILGTDIKEVVNAVIEIGRENIVLSQKIMNEYLENDDF